MKRQIKLLYFATVREKIGIAEEEFELPHSVITCGDLLDWLRTRVEKYVHAFADSALRVALDRQHVRNNSPLKDAKVMAIFPPMTGG